MGRAWLIVGLALVACDNVEPPALRPPNRVRVDTSSITDGGVFDSAAADATSPDAGPIDGGAPDGGAPDSGTPAIDDGPNGFIGSACADVSACDFDDAVCFAQSYPRGTCSKPCDRLCPNRDGHPVTFCVDAQTLPGAASTLGTPGACMSRCDFGQFPGTGCRPGYGCDERPRATEPGTTRMVCLPGVTTQLSDCQRELAAMGVPFEPTVIADRTVDGQPNLRCHVEDPVILHPPIHGVEVMYFDGSASRNVYAACAMAKALTQTIDDLAAHGVTKFFHMGTYNCREIRGTGRLSRHGMGDAIDIAGFETDDGTRYSVLDHWEHDTTAPMSSAARFLYEAAHRWFDAKIWNIILTPNYNAAHDNHFHVDLTPGSDFLRFTSERYIGPAPYAD